MTFLTTQPNDPVHLKQHGTLPKRVHVFDQYSINAVNAAIAAKRPLLVKGEPGTGKTQLARAVAKELQRFFVQYVVDAHCESQDLLWHFDAVQRLADAQLGQAAGYDKAELKKQLQLCNYIHPGPLWWAFNWESALEQASKLGISEPEQEETYNLKNGCVLLIDEIDKAEMDVPNGLLEALGEGRFMPKGWHQPVIASDVPPLVIITTNEERDLPNAFLRRCLVLHLKLDEQNLVHDLVKRGKVHFPELQDIQIEIQTQDKSKKVDVLTFAAEMLKDDRQYAVENQLHPKPGLAEYLDLLRAFQELRDQGFEEPEKLLENIRQFVLKK